MPISDRMKSRAWKNTIFNAGLAADERIEDPEAFRRSSMGAGVGLQAECVLDIIADLEAMECRLSTGKWPWELDAEEEPHALHAVAERWERLARVVLPQALTITALQTAATLMAETCRAMAAEGVEPYPQSAPCARCSDEVKTHVALCSSCYAKALPMAMAGDGPCEVDSRPRVDPERLRGIIKRNLDIPGGTDTPVFRAWCEAAAEELDKP